MTELTNREKELLKAIHEVPRFPIARFELRSTKQRELLSFALKHVYLTDPEASMEQVKADSAALEHLSQEKLITLDYALAVTVKKDYDVYFESELYKQFCEMVEEGKKKPGFLFDTPAIRRGVAKLTAKGQLLAAAQ